MRCVPMKETVESCASNLRRESSADDCRAAAKELALRRPGDDVHRSAIPPSPSYFIAPDVRLFLRLRRRAHPRRAGVPGGALPALGAAVVVADPDLLLPAGGAARL